MSLFDYFDLGLGDEESSEERIKVDEEEPTLGKPSPKPSPTRRRAGRATRRRFALTLAMYVGIFLGVVTENWLTLLRTNQGITVANFGLDRVFLSEIIATAIFPHVFPRVFGKGEMNALTRLPINPHVLQFCIAFQNGFFWQSLLKVLTPSA